MISRTSASAVTLMLAAALSLSACGDSKGNDGNPAPKSVAQAAGNEATQEKMSLYIDAFNALIHDHWGVSKKFEEYQKLNIPAASASANLYFPENISHLERAIAKLKEGRALNGGNQGKKADEAADKLIPQLEALLAQWQALDPYFESRAYRDDSLAKAKEAHPALMQAYQGSVAGIEQLDVALSEYQRASNAAKLEVMRKGGHTAEASLLDAMQKADLFTNAVMEDNRAEADAQLPAMEAAITALREEQAKLPSDNSNKSYLSSIADNLSGMVGAYRDFKQSNSESYRESVIDRYNSAIGNMNRVELPA
ncbi:DUF3829 domain-containing protein [Brevundimonas diminuta]|uniref:DUF3829 domain-containing protein n=1 Tax=Brevundimonas diminuta TaxID=293 RepID=UPI003CFE5684